VYERLNDVRVHHFRCLMTSSWCYGWRGYNQLPGWSAVSHKRLDRLGQKEQFGYGYQFGNSAATLWAAAMHVAVNRTRCSVTSLETHVDRAFFLHYCGFLPLGKCSRHLMSPVFSYVVYGIMNIVIFQDAFPQG